MQDTHDNRIFGLRRNDLLVLLLSIVMLTVIMWLMNRWLFPDGTGLDPGTRGSATAGWSATGDTRDFSVLGGAVDETGIVATLSQTRRIVKLRAADDVVWTGAASGAALQNRDAVQTLARSSAEITFGAGNAIELGENSLVVIQTTGRDAFVPRRRSTLSLHSGEIRGALAATDPARESEGLDELDIELPFGRLRVFGGDAARFRIGVNPDETSTVSIFGGSAELRANGKTVRLVANQGITFGAGDDKLIVRDLPAAPRAIRPSNTTVIRYGDLPPPVHFAWTQEGDGVAYRFVLARDANFDDILVDRRLDGKRTRYDHLEDGRYFWKVTAVRGWQESPSSAARTVTLERDREPPKLSVQTRIDATRAGVSIVTGHTEPGAQVFVAGQPVTAGRDGRFQHAVPLEPGANLVVIEAIDDVGNIAFESRLIHNLVTHSAGDNP